MKKELKAAIPFDEAMAGLYRENPQLAMDVLNECMEENDSEMLLVTLRQVVKAFGGVAGLATHTGLNETSLYRTLSRVGNPNLKTFISIMNAMGLRMTFVPKQENTMPFIPLLEATTSLQKRG